MMESNIFDQTCPQGHAASISTNYTILKRTKIILFSSWLNLLLPFGPAAILAHFIAHHHGFVFLLSLLGIIPLAERLGFVTEQISLFTGPTVGGLLNATFGNATEMIISILALRNGKLRLVQQSLLGSVLSNMLLVLGSAFFAGGIAHINKDQLFNRRYAGLNSGMLLIAVMGLLSPAALYYTNTELHYGKSELILSRFISCVMLVAYASFLFFQIEFRATFDSPPNEGENRDEVEDSSDHNSGADIPIWEAIMWLASFTALIFVLSDYLVDAIEGASRSWNIPVSFISVIVLPIVGNAAEHASAVMFAINDKLDISLGVAIGSSTQISMFLIPFCVVIGWIVGKPMDLNFKLFETVILFITVLVVGFMLQDGTSNYIKGLMLILCYLVVAASFYVHVDPKSHEENTPHV